MHVASTSVFSFPPFRLDSAQRLLSRDGQPIALTPKEFETLLVLVEAGGKVVDKQDLIARVWPDSFVGDGSLARNISVLRKALGEEVIETHRGRGYRITLPLGSRDAPVGTPALGPAEMKTDLPVTFSEPEVRTSWWKRNSGLTLTAFGILLVAFAVLRFVVVRSARAHTLTSTAPIHSILIQKEGALDPLDEGFRLARPQGQYPQAIYNRETNGWDRWRIVSEDQNYYYRILSAAERDFALQRDWKLICICALESGGGEADVDLAGNGARFDMEFLREGNRYYIALVNQLSPDFKWDQKIEFPGVGDVEHPHTYELRYDHLTQTASLWLDGERAASGYRGYHQFQDASKPSVVFGAFIYEQAPKGSFVSRRVRFEAN